MNISPRSALTAQFVYHDYIPDQYGKHTLSLGNNEMFPVETRIIMVDRSENQPNYYYQCDHDNVIDLCDFRLMGIENERYTIKMGSTQTSENFIFVIDFSNCTATTGLIAEGRKTLTLKVEKSVGADASVHELDSTLGFEIGSRSAFKISVDDTLRVGGSKNITYEYSQSSGYEKLFVGQQAELVLYSKNFPVDLYAEYDKIKYFQYSDQTIFIPLNAVSQISPSGTLTLQTKEQFSDAISVEASLWVVNEKNHGDVNHGRIGIRVAKQEFSLVSANMLSVRISDLRGDVTNRSRILSSNDTRLTLTYKTKNFTSVSASVRISDGGVLERIDRMG